MHFVYILYSEKIDRFYIGHTQDVIGRVERHNSNYYVNKWSSRGQPWSLYFQIPCDSKTIAMKIEAHIKNMKSKKYIHNLKRYPEMSSKLIEKYRR